MLKYLAARVAMTLVVIIIVMSFLAVLVHLIPGNPVSTIMGPRASPELAQIVRHDMQLDRPIPVQVVGFIVGAFQGKLGVDFISNVPVTTLVLNALPQTLALAFTSLFIAVVVGIPTGVFAAKHVNGVADRLLAILSVSFVTMPAFVIGLLLLLAFSVHYHVFPAIGSGSMSDPGDYLRHLVLPAFALAITWIGYIGRLVRTNMLEVLGEAHVRTSLAQGLQERTVFYKLALKNALIPVIAVLGVGLGSLIGGAIFVEVIFARPGIGSLIYSAIETRNYPVVRGGVLVVAVLFVLSNLLADLLYRFLDPRVRVEARSIRR